MKKLFILFFFFSFQIFPQIKSLIGIVIDAESKANLQLANVMIKGTSIGTTTDESGRFIISGKFSSKDTLLVSFVGYNKFTGKIGQLGKEPIVIELQKVYLQSQTILIEASVGKQGITPIAFDKIRKSRNREKLYRSRYS